MATFIAASQSQSRVFVAEGLPGPDNPPVFQGCLVMGGASQGLGDVEFIYCPDPENYDQFVPVGTIVGREENVETSLSGHFPLNTLSNIIKWGKAKTPLAIHVHFGTATNPQNFNVFTKAVIFDDRARITSTDIEEMGSLDESGPIGQSADISAASYYEVVDMNWISRVPELMTTPGAGIDAVNVYDETLPLDNRFAYYAVTAGDGGVTDPELVYTVNGGTVWSNITITDLTGLTAAGVAVVNDVPVVIGTAGNLYYSDVLGGATVMTEVVFAQAMSCITSIGAKAYIGGAAGYVGELDDYTATPTAMTTGGTANVLSIHALDGGIILVGDADGFVYYAVDGENFGAIDVAGPAGITAVCAVDADTFWAGTDTGELYYSTNAGSTWALRGFPASGSGSVTDITFPTLSVGFIAHDPAAGNARIIKTTGAGATGTWYEIPRTGALPTADSLQLASVNGDANRVLSTGPVAATTGIIIFGLGT
jgi:hypothetical protein